MCAELNLHPFDRRGAFARRADQLAVDVSYLFANLALVQIQRAWTVKLVAFYREFDGAIVVGIRSVATCPQHRTGRQFDADISTTRFVAAIGRRAAFAPCARRSNAT